MPKVFKLNKSQTGFAHPVLVVGLGIAFVLIAFLLYKGFKERPIESTSYQNEEVAGLSTPNSQIASIPKAECDIFVATNGNDDNNGSTENTPVRKIQTAANRVQAGQAICIKGGEYREVVLIANKNGTAGNPIKIGGYTGGGLPIISGGITNNDEYTLPNSNCKVLDVCQGNPNSAGGCNQRNSCVRQTLFNIMDSSNLQVYGIDVRGSSGRGFGVGNSNDISVKGVRSYHNWSQGFQIWSETANSGNNINMDYTATYDNIRAMAEKGIAGGGAIHVNKIKSGSIKNSLVFENFGEGLDVHKDSADFEVSKSMFWDNYHAFLYANGSTDATLDSNLLFCTKNRVSWLEENGVNPGKTTGYGSAITLRNEEAVTRKHGENGGTIASNNLILGCTNSILIAGQGVATLSDVKVLNNTIVSPRDFPEGGKFDGKQGEGISLAGKLINILIENNVILADSTGESINGASMASDQVKYVNNIVSTAPARTRTGVRVADPKLGRNVEVNEVLNPSDIRVNDYMITAGSPAIGAGVKTAGSRGTLDTDFYGNSRGNNPIDLGAYEFGSSKNWNNLYATVMTGTGNTGGGGGNGEPPVPPTPADTDGDGIPNKQDECPRTPQGNTPDPQKPGCPLDEVVTEPGVNKVKNSAFKDPATPGTDEVAQYWTVNTGRLGSVTASIERARNTDLAKGETLLINVVKNPIQGAVYVGQSPVDLAPSSKYEVSFAAKSSALDSTLIVDIRELGAIKEPLAPRKIVNLEQGWKQYTYTIVTRRYNPNKAAKLFIRVVTPNASNVTLDNVVIKAVN